MTLPVAPPQTSLTDIAAAVQPALESFIDERRDLVEPVGPVFTETTAGLERFVLRGGKRIRPAFAWAGWLAGGGEADGDVARAALRACASLEFVQACALIHDDIIDASLTRRGFPTTHREFAQLHADRGWSGSSEKFGEATAILLGDLALAWADDMFLGAGLAPERYLRAARAWAAMRTEVLGGQLLDIVSEASRDESEEAAERVVRFKTAGYTVERPLHVGAALAGASDATIDALREIGVDLGVAFQLRDDLLGAFGDPAVTGKPSGDDLRSGKHTPMPRTPSRPAAPPRPSCAAWSAPISTTRASSAPARPCGRRGHRRPCRRGSRSSPPGPRPPWRRRPSTTVRGPSWLGSRRSSSTARPERDQHS